MDGATPTGSASQWVQIFGVVDGVAAITVVAVAVRGRGGGGEEKIINLTLRFFYVFFITCASNSLLLRGCEAIRVRNWDEFVCLFVFFLSSW